MTRYTLPAGSRRRIVTRVAAVLMLASVATACASDEEAPDDTPAGEYPSRDAEWVVPFGPGSGGDTLARTIIDISERYDLYPHEMTVRNLEGSSGSVGYTHVKQRAGDPYVLSVTSSSYITVPLISETTWQSTEFTPVALVGRDDYVLAVNAGDYSSLEEFATAAESDPPDIGLVSLTTAGYLVADEVADAAGYEWQAVPFSDNGTMFSALFSGSIDALVTNPGEVVGQLEVGDMVGLAVSSEERMDGPGLEEVPTFAELGYETTASLPRGIIMAPNVSQEAQDFWVDLMREVAATPEWEEFLAANNTSHTLLFGQDWGDYVTDLAANFEQRLTEAGVIE